MDRVVALIDANKGDEGGRPVYGADKGNMGKGWYATVAAAACVVFVVGGGVVVDQSKDATA